MKKNTLSKILKLLRNKSLPLFSAIILYLICQLATFNLFSGIFDEGFTLYNAQLITQGQVPYRDFFLMTTPGSYYILALFLNLFGNYIIVGRILGIISIIITLFFCHKLFQFKRHWQYIYLFSLSIIFASPARSFTYNDAYLISILALYFLARGIEKDKLFLLGVSGFLSAICFILKQSVGGLLLPAFIAGVFLVSGRNTFQKVLAYIGGVLMLFIPVFFYFFIENALPQALYYIFSFAKAAKDRQISFMTYRVILIPIIWVSVMLFRHYKSKIRFLIILLIFFAYALYLADDPGRIERVVARLSNITFYIQNIVYVFVVFVFIFSINAAKKNKTFTLTSLLMLVVFFSAAASGYINGAVMAITPLLMPVLIGITKKYKTRIVVYGITGIIVIYVVLFSYRQFIFLGNNSIKNYTAYSSIREVAGIRFIPEQANELGKVVSHIKSHTKVDEKIFCFPYCPGLYFLSERNGGSYYSLFCSDTFMERDQDQVIFDLRKNKVKLVILQKTGVIEPRTELEEKRLFEIRNYITSNFQETLSTPNFIVLEN